MGSFLSVEKGGKSKRGGKRVARQWTRGNKLEKKREGPLFRLSLKGKVACVESSKESVVAVWQSPFADAKENSAAPYQ